MRGMEPNATEMIMLLTRALAPDFRLVPLHTPDLPVFLAVAWPGTDAVTGLKPRLPAGRGLTPLQALVSAGAEAVELRASLAQRHLSTLADLPRDGGVAMTTALDLYSGKPVPIAAQEIYLDCAATLDEPLVVDATSTGSAAGPTRAEATLTALWECIERDAVALWWHGGQTAGALSLDLLDRQRPRLSWWLTARDRTTLLLDLTTDIGLPVVAAVSSNTDGREVALGTAARPRVADAALAAVTEMIQTEVSMQEARLADDAELALWDEHASTRMQPQFRTSARQIPPTAGTDDLLARLTALGHPVLTHDMTLPGDPLQSMRVLVRGLCALGGRIETARFQRLCPANLPPTFPEPY